MIGAIVRKELLQLRRDPRLLAMIVVMPLVLLLLFGVALKLEPENLPLAYYDGDRSLFSNLVKTGLWSEGYFELYEVGSDDAIVAEIRAGRARAGVAIDADFSALLVENRQPRITFYVDGSMPSLATAMKYHSAGATGKAVTGNMYFQEADDAAVVVAEDPFVMDTVILFNPDEKETWFFLPGVIGVLIMQVALILTSISVVREREKGNFEQLLATPMGRGPFIVGKLLPYIAIGLLDFYFILGAGWLMFDLPAPYSHALLFVAALIYVSVMIAIGLLISLIVQTQQQAMFIAIFIIIPSVLLSGFIFPLEAIPWSVRPVSYVIPFTYFVDIMRGLLVKQTEIADLLLSYLALCGFLVLFVVASLLKFRRSL